MERVGGLEKYKAEAIKFPENRARFMPQKYKINRGIKNNCKGLAIATGRKELSIDIDGLQVKQILGEAHEFSFERVDFNMSIFIMFIRHMSGDVE